MSDVLHKTRALCPECLRVLSAEINADDQGRVWMTRVCPEHGEVATRIWPEVKHYQWMSSLAFPKLLPASDAVRPSAVACPRGCGICQRHQRKPTLVEIEVTQRCNLHCPVCFMSAEADSSDVPLEHLTDFFATIAHSAGTNTGVQLTGGEPTVRSDLAEVVRIGRDQGFWGVEVNTNGVVIARDLNYLRRLVDAGCTGIYLQFDGLTSDVYQQIRGADLLATKLRAVQNCRSAGVQVVLAMTIVSGINESQIGDVIAYALDNSDVVAGVALQPAFTSGRFDARRVEPLTMGDVIVMLEEQTAGMIRVEDIWPLGCSHPLCDTGTFLVPVEEDVAPKAAARPASAAVADAPKAAVTSSQTRPSPAVAPAAFSNFIPATRDLTREEYLSLYNPDSPQGSVFLDILARRGTATARGVSLIIMNYMDAWTMDLERMEECSMFVTMPDGAVIPFCSYQLTDCRGQRIFPPWNIPGSEKGVAWNNLPPGPTAVTAAATAAATAPA
ncbi:MAG: radical SAM protein, partial [Coriobacteriales bacterium]|nr:radical SAM protein [Coriobacteriales bacterium]